MLKSWTKSELQGIRYTIAAFSLWGILPLYWKLVHGVSATQVLAHRVWWSFAFLMGIIVWGKRWRELTRTLQRNNWAAVVGCAILIAANWFFYIWSILHNRLVEASLGYYITPIFNVLLGFLVLRERLGFWHWAALVLAITGVGILTASYGFIPWVALVLALSFGCYGLLKKMAGLDALMGLTLETAVLSLPALGYLLFQTWTGAGVLGTDLLSGLLLIGSGVVTAIPLLWFARGALQAPLSTIGFIQYLSPSISLLLGVFLFREPFHAAHGWCFGFIWTALGLYTLSQTGLLPPVDLQKIRRKEKSMLKKTA